MRIPITAAVIVISSSCTAQLIERNAQTSWMSSTDHVVRWNDSLWAFVGNAAYLGSPLSSIITTVIDDGGGLNWEMTTLAPGQDGTFATAIARLNDSTLLAGGWTRELCDAGGDRGFLIALGLYGDSLWSKSFGIHPLYQLAAIDTVILAASGDQVLVLDQAGDSLDQVTLPLGSLHRLRTSDTLALAACDLGALVLDASAAVLAQRSFINAVDDLVRCSDSSYACLSGGWLFLLDSALVPTDSVAYEAVGPNASLHEDMTYLWVIGGDTARFFDPLLQQQLVFALAPPAGHSTTDADVGPDVIMTSGFFQDGDIRSAVQRSVGKHGELFDIPVDAALGTVSAEDIVVTPGLPDQYTVDLVLRAWVRNESGDILNTVFLDLIMGSGPCGPAGIISQTGLGLLPGDSVLAYLGGVSTTVVSPDSVPVSMNFCLRATTPDGYMDRDTTNNYSCAAVSIPIGIPEGPAHVSLMVFPNPATDHLTLLPPFSDPGDTYLIIDQAGRAVLSGSLTGNTVDLTTLESGSYALLLRDGRLCARFIKLP